MRPYGQQELMAEAELIPEGAGRRRHRMGRGALVGGRRYRM